MGGLSPSPMEDALNKRAWRSAPPEPAAPLRVPFRPGPGLPARKDRDPGELRRLLAIRIGAQSRIFESAQQQLEVVPLRDLPDQSGALGTAPQKVPHEAPGLLAGEL